MTGTTFIRLLIQQKTFRAYPESSSPGPPEADGYQLSSRPKLAIKAA